MIHTIMLILVMSLPDSMSVTSQKIEMKTLSGCSSEAKRLEKDAGHYAFLKAYCVEEK